VSYLHNGDILPTQFASTLPKSLRITQSFVKELAKPTPVTTNASLV